MTRKKLAYGLAKRAETSAVNNANGGHSGDNGIVQVRLQFFQSILDTPAAHIELIRDARTVVEARQDDVGTRGIDRRSFALAEALDIVGVDTQAHRAHLHLDLAMVRRNAEDLGGLAEAEDANSIA